MADVERIEVADEWVECPSCSYRGGFHVVFRRVEADEGGNDVAVQLLCPSCHDGYDIGLRTRLAPPG